MDWGYIITIIVTVGLGVATIILTLKVTRGKKLVWAFSTRHIIGRDAEAPPELKYVFGNREVSEVYETAIVFFNRGNDSFRGDLVPDNRDVNEPILIKFTGAEILRPPTVQRTSKGATAFSVEQISKDSVELHFPILNHNDGAIMEVWHTKHDSIDIPNADITPLKEFLRQRPEGFYGNITLPFALLAVFIWLLFSEIIQGKLLNDYLPLLTIVVGLFVLSIWGLKHQLRYKAFPSWSRTKKKTKQEQ